MQWKNKEASKKKKLGCGHNHTRQAVHATYGVNQFVGVAHGKTNDGHDDHPKPKQTEQRQPNAIGATSFHFNVAHAFVFLFRGRFRSTTPHFLVARGGRDWLFFFFGCVNEERRGTFFQNK
jgi:hypothetical protein